MTRRLLQCWAGDLEGWLDRVGRAEDLVPAVASLPSASHAMPAASQEFPRGALQRASTPRTQVSHMLSLPHRLHGIASAPDSREGHRSPLLSACGAKTLEAVFKTNYNLALKQHRI